METALVIGGSGGIGGAISKVFSRNDIKTYATYFRNRTNALKALCSLNNVKILYCDVTRAASVKNMIMAICQEETKIDFDENKPR
jgi:NAD(P)-dependent dehydrogenase (short-subunit alcohol dehydrogenase family)